MSSTGREDQAIMLEIALEALGLAVKRVAEAPASEARAMYVPLAEAVWWAICIDEQLEKLPEYKSRRNGDTQGKVLVGLRFARSALGHCQFFAVRSGGGLTLPLTIPFAILSYAEWLPASELPVIEQQGVRRHYDEDLAGHRVLETLDNAREWFERAVVEFRSAIEPRGEVEQEATEFLEGRRRRVVALTRIEGGIPEIVAGHTNRRP